MIQRLRSFGLDPLVHDPHCSADEAAVEGVVLSAYDDLKDLDLMVVSCPHRYYRQRTDFLKKLKKDAGLVDVKGAFADHAIAKKHPYWSL